MSGRKIMKLVQKELKKQITQENLERMIAYNVSNQKNYALRVVPLFLKKTGNKVCIFNECKGNNNNDYKYGTNDGG